MADDTQQNAPATDGIVWDSAPATVNTGAPAPAQQSASGSEVEWDDQKPAAAAEPTLRQQLQANTEPLPTDTGHPLTNLSNFGQDVLRRGARVLGNGVLDTFSPEQDSRPAAAQMADEMHHATDYAAPMHSILQRIREFGQDYKKDPGVAVANVAGDAGATAATARVAQGALETAGGVVDRVKEAQANRNNPLNTPAHRGFTAVIDQGKAGMGKNFDAHEVAGDVAPIIQQEIQSNRALRERILDKKATPKESYEAFQEAIHNAQSHIDQAHLEVLRDVKNQPVDVKPVLKAIDELKTEGMAKYAPDDLAELDALKSRIASVETLGELNGLRMYINNQTSPTFKMSGVAVQRSATLDKAMNAAGSATRDAYYDGLSQATGQDFKKLKQTESNLLTTREALENAKGPLVSKEIQYARPMTGKQKVGAVAEGAASVVKGDKSKIAGTVLRESPMAQTHADIRRFVKNIPESVPGTFDSGVRTPDRPRLPKQASPHNIPVETTPNPRPRGPMDEVGGGASPNQLPQGQDQTLARQNAGGSVQVDNTGQLPSGPAAPQGLPQGTSPRALPDTGSNSRVAVPGKPHPGVNKSTAVDRTSRPIYPKPGTPVNNTVRVTPEGEAHIQREGLPAPAKKARKPKNQ
jgi:hypothetical protein